MTHFIKMTKLAENGLCYSRHPLFLQKLIPNTIKTHAFQAASNFFETNREVPAIFFQTCRKFFQFKTPVPGQRKLGETPTPQGVRTCESPGNGQAWN